MGSALPADTEALDTPSPVYPAQKHLAKIDPQQRRVAESQFLSGLSIEDTASFEFGYLP